MASGRREKCCIDGCASKATTVRMYTLPTESNLRSVWIRHIESRTTTRNLSQGTFVKNICRLHFEDKYIKDNGCRLRYALPNLFSKEEISSRVASQEFSIRHNHFAGYIRQERYTEDKSLMHLEDSDNKFRNYCFGHDHNYDKVDKLKIGKENYHPGEEETDTEMLEDEKPPCNINQDEAKINIDTEILEDEKPPCDSNQAQIDDVGAADTDSDAGSLAEDQDTGEEETDTEILEDEKPPCNSNQAHSDDVGDTDTDSNEESLAEAQDNDANSSFGYDDDADNASTADTTPEEQEIEIKIFLEKHQNYTATECPDPLDLNAPSNKAATLPIIQVKNVETLKCQKATETPEKSKEFANDLRGKYLDPTKTISELPTIDLTVDNGQKPLINTAVNPNRNDLMGQKKENKKVVLLKGSEPPKILTKVDKPPQKEISNLIPLRRVYGPAQTKENAALPSSQYDSHKNTLINTQKQVAPGRDLGATQTQESATRFEPRFDIKTLVNIQNRVARQLLLAQGKDAGPTQTQEGAPRPELNYDRKTLIIIQKEVARQLLAHTQTNLAPLLKKRHVNAMSMSQTQTNLAPLLKKPHVNATSMSDNQTNLAPLLKKRHVNATSMSPSSPNNMDSSRVPPNGHPGQRSKLQKPRLKSPNEIALTKRRLNILKSKLSKARIEMKDLRKRVKQIDNIESPILKSLIECTLRNQKCPPRSKRWSKSVRKLAVDIFNKSPLVYSDLGKVFDLPTSIRLKKKLRIIDSADDDDQTDVREPIMDEERICSTLLKQMSTMNKKVNKDMLISQNMKIVIRGDRKVGKSCLLQRLQGGPFIEEYVQTDEIQVAPIEWTSKNCDHIIKIDVWDVVDKGSAKKPPSGANVDNQSAPSAIENDPETPVLDASSINVYEKASGVILMLDITNYQSFEYVVKELSLVPPELPVVILGNHCDMQHHRQVHAYHIEAALHQARQNREAPVRYAETSMRNGFGLRLLHKFLSVPFLRLQRACLLDQLHRNQREIEQMEKEIDRFQTSQEYRYTSFASRLAKNQPPAAVVSSPPAPPAPPVPPTVTKPSVAKPLKQKPQATKRKHTTSQQKTPQQKKPRKFMYPELLKPTRPIKSVRQCSTAGRSPVKSRAGIPEEYHAARVTPHLDVPVTQNFAYDIDSQLADSGNLMAINTLEDIEDELSMTIIESTTSTKLPVNRNHNEQSNIRQKSLKSVQVKKGANSTGPSLSMPSLDHSFTNWDDSREKGSNIGKVEKQYSKKKRTGVGDS